MAVEHAAVAALNLISEKIGFQSWVGWSVDIEDEAPHQVATLPFAIVLQSKMHCNVPPMTGSTTDMALRIDQWRMPTKPETALMCWSKLPGQCMSDPSRSFYGFDAIGVPVQDRQIEAIPQKGVVLGGKVFLDSRQVSRERL